jgi:hypothetical protein
MTYQERRSLSNIVMTIILTLIYGIVMFNKYNNGDFDTTNMMRFWSMIILLFIPLSIIGRIILMIIFRIFGEISDEVRGTKESDRDIVDERDKMIALRSTRNSLYVFILGFIVALAGQLLGGTVSLFFIIMISGGILSDIITNVSEILYYRRGV